VIKRHLSFDTI